MKKLGSDIRRATEKYEHCKRKYEEARAYLQNLMELGEADKMGEEDVKPNLRNVIYHGAYLGGVQAACKKILNDWFKMDNAGKLSKKDDRLVFEAVLEIVLESKLDAGRWIGEGLGMMFEPVGHDKKGNVTKYKASWYVERVIKTKI